MLTEVAKRGIKEFLQNKKGFPLPENPSEIWYVIVLI
jgi:hypothetical protein